MRQKLWPDPILGVLLKLALRACEPDPQKRFSDAGQMLVELESRLHTTAASRSHVPRRAVFATTFIVLLLGVTAAAFWASRPRLVHVNFVTHPFEATHLARRCFASRRRRKPVQNTLHDREYAGAGA